MKVSIDIDGVMSDFSHAFSTLCNEKYGTDIISTKDVPHWDWSKFYPITKEQISDMFINVIGNSNNFWKGLNLLQR